MKKLVMMLLLVFGMIFVSAGIEVNAASKVSLSAEKVTLSVGNSKKLKLKGAKNAVWKSSNKKIATVSKDGKVRAVKAGSCKITATANGKSYTCSVTVKAVDKNYVGSYKVASLGYDDVVMGEEYFDIYEKHGIILYSVVIKENGKVTMKTEADAGKTEEYTLTDKYLVSEKGNKIVYMFKDGDIILFESNLSTVTDITLVKMTDAEIKMSNKKVTDKQKKEAEDEINAYMLNDKDIMESNTMKKAEQYKLSNDNWDYDTLVQAATVTVFNSDVKKELDAGHKYKIVMTKEGTDIYKDGKAINKEDAFYKELTTQISEYTLTSSKVRSAFAEKYVIDIESDGTVKKTQAPKKVDEN